MATMTVADIDCAGKRVFVRVDFNVPLDAGRITDDKRIVAAVPTIRHLVDGGAVVVLASHLGRPKGKGFEAEFSLKPAADRLGELLGKPVKLGPPEVVGPETEKLVAGMAGGGSIRYSFGGLNRRRLGRAGPMPPMPAMSCTAGNSTRSPPTSGAGCVPGPSARRESCGCKGRSLMAYPR